MERDLIHIIQYGPAGGTTAPAQQSAQGAVDPTGGMSSWIMIIVFFVLMWVLLIMPQKKQEKKHKEMLSKLEKGDKVVTNGGIIGKVVMITNDKVRITTGDRTEIDVLRSAISGVTTKKPEDEKAEKTETTDKKEEKTEKK